MAGRIGVLILAFDHIRHGLKTTMRMVGRANRLAGRVDDRPEFVDQQKRINLHDALHRKWPVHQKAAALMEILGRQHERNLAF